MEQNFSTLTARLCKVETYAASASNVSGSARSWPSLEQVDGSTAAGSHGPGASNDNRNTRRRLDTSSSPADEHARSAVLVRFHVNSTILELRSGSILFGKGPTYQPTINLSQFIARQAPCQAGLYLKQEPNVKTLLPDIKIPFAASKQLSRSANPKPLKTGRSESNLRLCGECWQINSKILFPDGDDEGALIVPCARRSLTNPQHEGSKKWCWKTSVQTCTLLEADSCLLLLHLTCVFLRVSNEVLQRVISQTNTTNE